MSVAALMQSHRGGGAALAASATHSSRHSTGAHLSAAAEGEGAPPPATRYTHTALKNGTSHPPRAPASPFACPHCHTAPHITQYQRNAGVYVGYNITRTVVQTEVQWNCLARYGSPISQSRAIKSI